MSDKRLCITFDNDLITDIDSCCARFHLSRSAFIRLAVSNYVNETKVLSCLPNIEKLLADIKSLK